MSLFETVVPILTAASSASVGWILARRRGHDAIARAEQRASAAREESELAARRASEAQAESARWRGMSLADTGLSTAREPVYASRPCPRDATELARLARGLALIDDVMIADAEGLPMITELDTGSIALAALAAPTARSIARLGKAGIPVVQVAFESFAAEHVAVRALPGRADGLLLVLRTTSERANPLVIDAVVHAAARATETPPAALPPLELGGTTETRALEQPELAALHGDLVRELRDDVRAIVLTLDGRPVFSAAANGPAEASRSLVAEEVTQLQLRVAHLLRSSPLARVELTLRDRTRVTWAAVAPGSRLALLAFGPLDPRAVERVAGKLRRVFDTSTRGKAA